MRSKTGLYLDPYFSASKLKWLLENSSKLKEKILLGEALIGTIDTYLLYRLTACKAYKTEASNASRTLLYNLKSKDWDQELCDIFGRIPFKTYQKYDSHTKFGLTKNVSGLVDGIEIHGILGDQQAALFGHKCFHSGEAKCTYGTGAFFLMQTKENLIEDPKVYLVQSHGKSMDK